MKVKSTIVVKTLLLLQFLSTKVAGQPVVEEAVPFDPNRIITILRIEANDSNATITEKDLSSSVFGDGRSVKTQFKECTETINVAANENVTGFNEGVVTIKYDGDVMGKNVKDIIVLIRQKAITDLLNNDGHDHLMFCFPHGTEYDGSDDWDAFVLDTESTRSESYFNSGFCDKIGLQMKMIAQNNPFNLKPHDDKIGVVSMNCFSNTGRKRKIISLSSL